MADALSRLSMGSVAHVEDGKRELVKDVHHLAYLGVRLNDSNKGGIHMHNRFESSLVKDIMEKQDVDLISVELKKLWVKRR